SAVALSEPDDAVTPAVPGDTPRTAPAASTATTASSPLDHWTVPSKSTSRPDPSRNATDRTCFSPMRSSISAGRISSRVASRDGPVRPPPPSQARSRASNPPAAIRLAYVDRIDPSTAGTSWTRSARRAADARRAYARYDGGVGGGSWGGLACHRQRLFD